MQVAVPAMLLGIAGQTFAGIQAAKGQARAAEAEAAAIRESAAVEEAQTRRAAARVLAQNRAIGAASGVDLSTGSPLLLELENARQAELEALTLRRTGQRQAEAKTVEARLARRSILGTLLGGVGQAGAVFATSGSGASASGGRFGRYGESFAVRGPGGGLGPV